MRAVHFVKLIGLIYHLDLEPGAALRLEWPSQHSLYAFSGIMLYMA